jgi:hypothetical protein
MKGGPQKWLWFLEAEGVLVTDDSDSPSLEDPSNMLLDRPIIPIEKALRWLEYARNHILPILFFSLERAKKQLQVAEAGVQHRQRIVQRYHINCDPSPAGTGASAAAAASATSATAPTSVTESTMAVVWSTRRSFLQEVMTYYSPPKEEGDSLEILSTLLESSEEPSWDVLEGNLQSIQLALVELVAFVKCRRALPAVPSYLVAAIDEDQHSPRRLEEWEQQLQATIEDFFEPRRKRLAVQEDELQALCHMRWQESKERLVKAEQALRQAKDLVVSKEEELAAARRSVMSIKQKVEEEIVALLKLGDDDDPICIEVM